MCAVKDRLEFNPDKLIPPFIWGMDVQLVPRNAHIVWQSAQGLPGVRQCNLIPGGRIRLDSLRIVRGRWIVAEIPAVLQGKPQRRRRERLFPRDM
jgi:hypothetical protein